MKYGLVKPTNHPLTFVGVTLDGHTYTLEKKGGPGKKLKCQAYKQWIRKTDGVVLHKPSCGGGPESVDKVRRMVIDWAYFVSYQTQMAMIGPIIGVGRLCGLELAEEDFIGARDRIDDLLRSAGRIARKKVMENCKSGTKEFRKFNTKFPNGPTYTTIPMGAGTPVVVRDVPAAADHVTTLANIEAERQKAVRPLRLAMAANAARLNELDILVSL